MRTFVKIQVPVQRGSKAVQDGSLGKIIAEFMERARPEAAYFGLESGDRTAFFVLDVKDSSELPPLFEPLFVALDASIEMSPVMNADELKQGISRIRL
jgi:hypothetical protein